MLEYGDTARNDVTKCEWRMNIRSTNAECPNASSLNTAARRVIERCDELANCTDTSRRNYAVVLLAGDARQRTTNFIVGWKRAGLQCRLDAAGNLIGRLRLRGCLTTNRSDESLLVGSHLDTVVNAGKYDGIFGRNAGTGCGGTDCRIATKNYRLPAGCDRVSARKKASAIKRRTSAPARSSAICLPNSSPKRMPMECAIAEALRNLRLRSRAIGCQMRSTIHDEVIAYIEPHIEQGPVLELEGLPVGIVSGIAGQTRAEFQFIGSAGHAGTVPMAAATMHWSPPREFITAVRGIAGRRRPGLVATVGQIQVSPNVSNVIPGEVNLRLDVRHLDDDARDAAFREITHQAAVIAEEREIEFDHALESNAAVGEMRCRIWRIYWNRRRRSRHSTISTCPAAPGTMPRSWRNGSRLRCCSSAAPAA